MNQKILLADDSLTIQKVIKITLANQPYDIMECSTDDELFARLTEVKPKLVCLDFNLSEKYTGYELTAKIKSLLPSTNVFLLLGTFDTVDDAAMEKCGASDKVVKPFDSNKFIAICKRLVDDGDADDAFSYPEPKKTLPPVQEEDQWQVSHSVETTELPREESPKPFDVRNHLNPLDQEMSNWGLNVPGVINESSDSDLTQEFSLPPVIGEARPVSEHVQRASEQTKYPDHEDLDYPAVEQPAPRKEPDVSPNLFAVEDFDSSSLEFEIEHKIQSMDESDITSLEAQIRDEVEDNLWHADEFEELKKEVSHKIDDFRNLQKNNHQHSSPEPEPTFQSHDMDKDQIVSALRNEMEDLIKKHVKEYMDEMFQRNVEKISWEVIPDLAENLIRQELGKISNKILDSN